MYPIKIPNVFTPWAEWQELCTHKKHLLYVNRESRNELVLTANYTPPQSFVNHYPLQVPDEWKAEVLSPGLTFLLHHPDTSHFLVCTIYWSVLIALCPLHVFPIDNPTIPLRRSHRPSFPFANKWSRRVDSILIEHWNVMPRSRSINNLCGWLITTVLTLLWQSAEAKLSLSPALRPSGQGGMRWPP